MTYTLPENPIIIIFILNDHIYLKKNLIVIDMMIKNDL